MVIVTGSKKTETIDVTDALETIEEEEDGEPGSMTKSPKLLRRSAAAKTMKSPKLMMKSPLIRKKRLDSEEMEFVSVGRKPKRMPSSSRGSGHRVIWHSSMKS